MKKNFISAIAGWKSAALLALVAMVAAVAFSGVLTSTESADAQPITDAAAGAAVPGQTVSVQFDGGTGTLGTSATTASRFRIDPASEGTAVFAANGATSIRCYNGSPTCDTDGATAATITLSVTVDADSPAPADIYVQFVERTTTGTLGQFVVQEEVIIAVSAPNPVTGITRTSAPPSPITASPTSGDTPRSITVKATDGRGFGKSGESLTVITTRGVLSTNTDGSGACISTDTDATSVTNPRGSCTISTVADDASTTTVNEAGQATVQLSGNGAPGVATLTFLHTATGTSFSQDVVLYGTVASISAEAQQSAVGIGGTTFIVVTVSDASGNPVAGASVNTDTADALTGGIVSPGAPPTQVKVRTRANFDYISPLGALHHLPACVDDTTTEFDVDGTPTAGARFTAGTNSAGKCVIQVGAPNGADVPFNAAGVAAAADAMGTASPADDATRGTHTITIKAAALPLPSQKVTVDIEVGGPPASIESDAPASVDPLSTNRITVTVLDDEGVRVGAVPISVVQVEGSGNVDKFPGGDAAETSDGRATFTYLAPLSSGEAVFLVRAGAPGQVIQSTITVAIGDAPAPESATWNNELVSGQNLVVWNGEDGADPSAGAADGVSAIWSYNSGSGSWDGYFPSAADVPGGNTLGSLGNGQAYVVIVD